MKAHSGRPFALPLPAFVLHPVTALAGAYVFAVLKYRDNAH
jgi:hypothetical protein